MMIGCSENEDPTWREVGKKPKSFLPVTFTGGGLGGFAPQKKSGWVWGALDNPFSSFFLFIFLCFLSAGPLLAGGNRLWGAFA